MDYAIIRTFTLMFSFAELERLSMMLDCVDYDKLEQEYGADVRADAAEFAAKMDPIFQEL